MTIKIIRQTSEGKMFASYVCVALRVFCLFLLVFSMICPVMLNPQKPQFWLQKMMKDI